MKEIEFKLRDEYIKLGQLLKAAGIADSGIDAKILITEGNISLNGNTEYQRGKKIVSGDVVVFEDRKITVK